MSENINECELHPTEEEAFRRSVLRALIGKQTFNLLSIPKKSEGRIPLNADVISLLGADVARSILVNDCADRITDGTCTRFVMNQSDFGIVVELITNQEQ